MPDPSCQPSGPVWRSPCLLATPCPHAGFVSSVDAALPRLPSSALPSHAPDAARDGRGPPDTPYADAVTDLHEPRSPDRAADDHAVAASTASEAGHLLLEVREQGLEGRALEDAEPGRPRLLIRLLGEVPSRRHRAQREGKDDRRRRRARTGSGSSTRSTAPASSPSPARRLGGAHGAVGRRGGSSAGAVALPGLGQTFHTRSAAVVPRGHRRRPPRIVVSPQRVRPPSSRPFAEEMGGGLVPHGFGRAKVMSVVRDISDAYVHAGGQYAWDSRPPSPSPARPGCSPAASTVRHFATTRTTSCYPTWWSAPGAVAADPRLVREHGTSDVTGARPHCRSSDADGVLQRSRRAGSSSSTGCSARGVARPPRPAAAGNYEWRVQAFDHAHRSSGFSEPGSFTVVEAPTALALDVLAYNKVELTWQYGGTATDFAILRRSTNGALTEIGTVPGNTLIFMDHAVPPNEHVESSNQSGVQWQLFSAQCYRCLLFSAI